MGGETRYDEYFTLKVEIDNMKQEFAIMKTKLTFLEKNIYHVNCDYCYFRCS